MPALMASLLLVYMPFISLSNWSRKFDGMCTRILFVFGLFIVFTFYDDYVSFVCRIECLCMSF